MTTPATPRTITVEALAAALHRVPMMDWTDVDAVPDYAAAIFAALPAEAVNAHDALLAALRALVEVLGPATIKWTDPVPEGSLTALTDARALLRDLSPEEGQ